MNGNDQKVRRFLDEKAASAVLSVSTSTLQSWRSLGRGPGYFKLGKMVRYDLDEILSFADRHKVDPR